SSVEPWIPGRGRRERNMPGNVVRVNPAIVGPHVPKSELDAVSGFDPGDVLIDVPGALDGIGIDIRPPCLPLVHILARLSFDRSSGCALGISGLPRAIGYLVEVLRWLHKLSVVDAYCRMTSQFLPDDLVLVETNVPLPDVGRETAAG